MKWKWHEVDQQWRADAGFINFTVYRRNVHGFNWHAGTWRPAYGYFRFKEGSARTMQKAKLAAKSWLQTQIKRMAKEVTP